MSPTPETVEICAHVLYHYGQPGGYQPGSFVAKLLECFDKADAANWARLATAFPGYANAITWANSYGGMDMLANTVRYGHGEEQPKDPAQC